MRLSICIPVYNFGEYIGETLDSIINQMVDEIEIVIVDGASTDNTPEVVRGFQEKYPGINYVRLKKRGGIDNDIARAVDEASGDYCWLFSADDIMKPGAIATLLQELQGGFDIYLCGFTLCSYHMQPIANHRILGIISETIADLADDQERLAYFRKAHTTTEFFSYCSSLVINKARWDSVEKDESFTGSCWAHAARIFGMLPQGLRVKYLPGPFFSKRCDNDSFLDQGIVNRMRISIDGYHRMGEHFFGRDSEEAFHMRRCVRAEWPLGQIMAIKSNCIEQGLQSDLAMLDTLVAKHLSDPSIRNKLALIAYHHISPGIYRFFDMAVKLIRQGTMPIYKAVKKLVRPA